APAPSPPDEARSADETLDVRQQGELSGTLDGGAQLPLVPRAGAGQPARQNLAALGQEPGQRALVLEVHHPHAALADGTGLLRAPHSSSSSSLLPAVTGTGWAPSFTTTRNRITPSSSLMARSNSGSAVGSASNLATT